MTRTAVPVLLGLLGTLAGCSQPSERESAPLPAAPTAPVRYRICWTDGKRLFRMRPEDRSVASDPLPKELTFWVSPYPGLPLFPSSNGRWVATESPLSLLRYGQGAYVGASVPSLDSQEFPRMTCYADSVSDAPGLLAFGYGGINYVDGEGKVTRNVPEGIGILDLGTGAARPLPGREGRGMHTPSLSPDGQWLAFATLSKGYFPKGEIRKIRIADGEETRLSSDFSNAILWSPQGTYLSYSVHKDGLFKDREVLVVLKAADGSLVREIAGYTNPRGTWSWLPDESGLVYTDDDRSIWKVLLAPGGGAPVRLVDGRRHPSYQFREVCVSPDGRHVFFNTTINSGPGCLERVALEGSEPEQLTQQTEDCGRPYILALPPLPPADGAVQDEVARLASRLGDATFAVREGASRALRELAARADIQACLREVLTKASDPEVRDRIESLLRDMD